jgi:V/A-type H+-transporting ATPase subunit E
MKGIEKITARIAADAEAANSVVREESAKRIAEIRAEYEKQAQEQSAAILRAGEKEAQQLASRVERTAQLEAKRQLLAVKQEMVSEAFELAKSKFAQMPQAEYVAYLSRQIAAACSGDAQLVLNAADKAAHSAQLEALCNTMLKGKGTVTVAEETADIIGGFILKQGDVEVNGTVDILLELIRGELAAQVAQVLFEG